MENKELDYKIGDWVETCHMTPAIVQEINMDSDEVVVFYPYYAFKNTPYCGGSCCSISNCGVHKITPEYACKLMAIGYEGLKKLWEIASKEWENKSEKEWSEFVEEEYLIRFKKKNILGL